MECDELIELDDDEYRFLSEKFDIMSCDDVKQLPKYIVSSRKTNFKRLVGMAIENELDKTQQKYVREKFYDNLTVSEIAERNGVSRQSVYRVLEKATKTLSQVLKYAYYCGFSLLKTPECIEQELYNSITEGKI